MRRLGLKIVRPAATRAGAAVRARSKAAACYFSPRGGEGQHGGPRGSAITESGDDEEPGAGRAGQGRVGGTNTGSAIATHDDGASFGSVHLAAS